MARHSYENGAEHLLDSLGYLDLMLRRALVIARASRPASDHEAFAGMLISEAEMDRLFATVTLAGDPQPASGVIADLDAAIEQRRADIHHRVAEARAAGVHLPLAQLVGLYALSDAETDLLLVALAPELETRYETVYAYLQNDVTRKRPSVELALELICRGAQEKLAARRLLSPEAPLRHHRLLTLGEETYDREPTMLRRFLKLDDAVLRFVLGQHPAAGAALRWVRPGESVPELSTSPETGRALDTLVQALQRSGAAHSIVHLEGTPDAPLEPAAIALGSALDRPLLITSITHLAAGPEAAATLARDAVLWRALPVVRIDAPPEQEAERARLAAAESHLWAALREAGLGAVVLSTEDGLRRLPADFRLWRVAVTVPDFADRRALWEAALPGRIDVTDAERLADMFPFGAGKVRQAVGLAHTRAALRHPADPAPQFADLMQAARALATPNLQRYAVTVPPLHGWDDIVLPEDRKQQLRSVAARVTNRALVQRDWGFGAKLTRGRGLAVLLSGPPGTGKTMASEIIAAELALDLFQIDLSTVMSKYIGETEKQLAAIFAEAEQGQCILFFDECDSVFGKRTDVKDAHDYYANTQVNYLLQRLEQYEGIVLLATNFARNIDEAFLRRLHDSIDFPFPDEAAREQIWRRQFPPEAPLAKGIDFAALAAQFRLTGGGIRNAAQYAAYRAAETQGRDAVIGLDQILEGVRREFQKQGKLVVASDQGQQGRAQAGGARA
jgi:SpoVK/Ycf46/Vps4 family AAA+-type ATPase